MILVGGEEWGRFYRLLYSCLSPNDDANFRKYNDELEETGNYIIIEDEEGAITVGAFKKALEEIKIMLDEIEKIDGLEEASKWYEASNRDLDTFLKFGENKEEWLERFMIMYFDLREMLVCDTLKKLFERFEDEDRISICHFFNEVEF